MYAGQNSCYALAEAGYLASLNDLDCVQGREDSLASVTYDEDIVTATSGVSILGTYYNKDLFKEAGIESEPQTWDEFLEDCKKLKDAGIQPIVMGDKDQYVLQFGLYQLAMPASLTKEPGTKFLKCTKLCMTKVILMLPSPLDMVLLRQFRTLSMEKQL